MFGVLVLAAVALGVLVWRSLDESDGGRHAAAERFATAWVRGDSAGMWRALTPRARAAYPEARFAAACRAAEQAAGVRSRRAGALGGEHNGTIAFAADVRTADFGTLRGSDPLAGVGNREGRGR